MLRNPPLLPLPLPSRTHTQRQHNPTSLTKIRAHIKSHSLLLKRWYATLYEPNTMICLLLHWWLGNMKEFHCYYCAYAIDSLSQIVVVLFCVWVFVVDSFIGKICLYYKKAHAGSCQQIYSLGQLNLQVHTIYPYFNNWTFFFFVISSPEQRNLQVHTVYSYFNNDLFVAASKPLRMSHMLRRKRS